MRRLFIAALLAPALAFAPLHASAFSMDDILSAPFVSHLTPAPDGSFLVWEVHERGLRNLYANDGGTPHQVTAFDQDDGQDFDNVAVLHGNDAVVYMRGGTEDNSGGDNINPRSTLPPPERGVYVQSLHAGAPVQLGTGSQVRPSPTGESVAWVSSGVLNIARVQKNGATYTAEKPVPLSIRGTVSSPVWSPDGSKIAFTDSRGDHSFIVIYTPQSKSYVYATPDFSADDVAAWSPDGTRVAFVRTAGSREDESPYSRPSREPWSIWVARASDGSARRVWSAHRGMGAEFYPSETSAAQLWWMPGDRIGFLWEGTGWQNLYAVPAAGGAAQPLAQGPFEVETVAQSLDKQTLYLASNQGDIDRRHIWAVDANGRERQLTRGTEDQWRPVGLIGDRYAYVNAGYNTVPTIVDQSGARIVGVATPASFPATQVVEPKLVTFRAADGTLIHGQLFVPRSGGRHPAMIFDHGGPVRQMLPGFHYMEAYTNLYESNQYLANHGFVVLSINYRSGVMYGHAFREAKHVGAEGASEYQDVLAGAHYLQGLAHVDRSRIGIYGLSYGGYLCALALARNSDIFKAGVDYAGVHNWATLYDADYGKRVGTETERALAYRSSPIASLDTWHSPVFLSQGDDDRNVAFSQGVDLATRLRDRNVHLETMVFPNETHENQVYAHELALYEAAAAFLTRELHP